VPYVITEVCTLDGACVEVCPVACIHTTPEAPQFYIDPDICIECEQCEVVCPVDAIYLHTDLPPHWQPSIEVNASFFRKNRPPAGPVPVETALQVVQSAQAFAAEHNMAVTIAVVDAVGLPIVVSRMDGAQPWTPELAIKKAYTATSFQVTTSEVVPERRRPWFPSLVMSSRGQIVAAHGGLPILDGIEVIGAIGVAGGRTDDEDILCSRAGMAVLKSSVF
jgi:uncharacterized protein GlcG (DUF336 family)/NAD-dependent dihydropyrimidine dehydrogenase PreA subunit